MAEDWRQEIVTINNLLDVATKANLSYADLTSLYIVLGLSQSDVENAERDEAGVYRFQVQAVRVLGVWKARNGDQATKKVLLDAISTCGLLQAKQMLEEAWGIGSYGTETEELDDRPDDTEGTSHEGEPSPKRFCSDSDRNQDQLSELEELNDLCQGDHGNQQNITMYVDNPNLIKNQTAVSGDQIRIEQQHIHLPSESIKGTKEAIPSAYQVEGKDIKEAVQEFHQQQQAYQQKQQGYQQNQSPQQQKYAHQQQQASQQQAHPQQQQIYQQQSSYQHQQQDFPQPLVTGAPMRGTSQAVSTQSTTVPGISQELQTLQLSVANAVEHATSALQPVGAKPNIVVMHKPTIVKGGVTQVTGDQYIIALQDVTVHQQRERANVQKWKGQLQQYYHNQKKNIRFGCRHNNIASIDELCVDLELFEQDTSTAKLGNNVKRRRLETYQELFTLQDKYQILLFGEAGTGKTTQISRIAYDWAQNRENVPTSIELVFVLNIRSFRSNQTLADAIKIQYQNLLRTASTDDINQVFNYLGRKCLILLDGYDEIPRGLENHPLTNPPFDLFVIVTCRPHVRDQVCRNYSGYAHVQVSGFSNENIALYINKFFQNSGSNLAPSLIKYLDKTPLLQTLSSYPVPLVMICLLWEDSCKKTSDHEDEDTSEQVDTVVDSFQSMTNVYNAAVTQYLNKPFDESCAGKLNGQTIEQVLEVIGKTAFLELLENNIQIKERKFEKPSTVEKGLKMGLLTREEGKLVNDCSVSFIHKTFQEFCAASYLSSVYLRNKEEFAQHLSLITCDNFDEMEYLLRFCCGLNVEAAAEIFTHIVDLNIELHKCSYMLKRPSCWKLLVMLLYEIELSHCEDVKDLYHYHIHTTSMVKDVTCRVINAELLAALHHFKSNQSARDTWLGCITSVDIQCEVFNFQTIMEALCCMSSLKIADISIRRHEDYIVSLVDADLSQYRCESLQEFQLRRTVTSDFKAPTKCNVVSLGRILGCMPKLTKVSLENIELTGEMNRNTTVLSQLLKTFHMSSYSKMKPIPLMLLIKFLCCLPALTKVLLEGIELCGEFDCSSVLGQSLQEFQISSFSHISTIIDVTILQSLVICMPAKMKVTLKNIKVTNGGCLSLSELKLSRCKLPCLPVHLMPLVSLLSCMPEARTVSLEDIHLAGEIWNDPVVLCQSPTRLEIRSQKQQNVSVTTLGNLLRCMPELNNLSLEGIHLTRGLVSRSEAFSQSKDTQNHQTMGNVSVETLVSLLSCIPALSEVLLIDIHLTGEIGDNPKALSQSLERFKMRTQKQQSVSNVSVVTLASLLSCMPALTTVSLEDIHLTGEIGDNPIALSQSLKRFEMRTQKQQSVSNVSVVTLASLLSCMPALTKVSLEDINLTGEIGDNPKTLSQSLERFEMRTQKQQSVSNVSVVTLASLLSCMPALTTVSLEDITLTGEIGDNPIVLSKSLELFNMYTQRQQKVDVMKLASLLGCMGGLRKVSLESVQLIGGLERRPKALSQSLEEFKLSHRMDVNSRLTDSVTLNIMTFISLLSCMPGLNKVSLEGIQLIDEVHDNSVIFLSQSLKKYVYTGPLSCLPQLTTELLRIGGGRLGVIQLVEQLKMRMQKQHVNVSVVTLASLLSCMPALTTVSLEDINLTGEIGDNPIALSQSLEQFKMRTQKQQKVNVMTLTHLLSCMPGLKEVSLEGVQLRDELNDNPIILLSQSLKRFKLSSHSRAHRDEASLIPLLKSMLLREMGGEKGYYPITLMKELHELEQRQIQQNVTPKSVGNVSVVTLKSLLSCMPALTTMSLENINLTGEIGDNPIHAIVLSQSLEQFVIKTQKQQKVSMTTLANLLMGMPNLKEVSLEGFQLTGGLQNRPMALSQPKAAQNQHSVYNVGVVALASLLSLIPTHTTVLFEDILLAGEIVDDLIVLRRSLTKFNMRPQKQQTCDNINVMTLVRLLGCMPGLTEVSLTDIELTDECVGTAVELTQSLEELKLTCRWQGSVTVSVITLAWLLSCMPRLRLVMLEGIELTGELVGNHVLSSKTLLEFKFDHSIGADMLHLSITSFVSLLSCMPGLAKVSLTDVQFTGELSGNLVNLSQSLKVFEMLSNRYGRDSEKNLTVSVETLLKLLSLIPGLTKVLLINMQLTGELEGLPWSHSLVENEQRLQSYFKDHYPSCDLKAIAIHYHN